MAKAFYIEGLDEFKEDVARGGNEIANQVKWAMTQSVNAIKIAVRDVTPHKTGQLQRSMVADIQDGGLTGIVYSDQDMATYGGYIEYGTGPYDIYPVNGQALYWKGALHPVRHVHMPARAPRPFFYPAVEANLDKVVEYFERGLDVIIKIMAHK